MASSKTWCRICGKEYEVCPTCAEVKQYTPYRIICDTPKHFQLYTLIREYREGVVTPLEAKRELEQIGVSKAELKTLIQSVQDFVKEVRAVKEPVNDSEEAPNEEK